jgi:hypothetical protein
LRGGGCSVVDKFGCALCVRCGGEHCSIVSSQNFQPGCDIGRMIFTRLKIKLQIGAQERGPEFSNQFLDRVTFAAESMPAEVTVEPRLAAIAPGSLTAILCIFARRSSARHSSFQSQIILMMSGNF